MRISDWSSDVCSSDLTPEQPPIFKRRNHRKFHRQLHDSQFAPRRKVGLRGAIKAAGSIIGGRPKNPCETRRLSCSVPSAAAKTAALADKIAARAADGMMNRHVGHINQRQARVTNAPSHLAIAPGFSQGVKDDKLLA